MLKQQPLLALAFMFFTCVILATASSLESRKKDNEVAEWAYGSFFRPTKNSSINFELKFFAPTKPGVYPLIFFLTGLNGFAPNFFYTGFCEDLALKANSIIVVFDGLQASKRPEKEELLFEATFNWTLLNINSVFYNNKTPEIIKNKVFPDFKTNGVTLLSHSAGGHTVVSYLVKLCQFVTSLVLLDPVDGYDPFGIVKDFVTNPPQQLPFAVPTLLASTGLSKEPVNKLFPACAPTDLSNMRFYDSLPGPTWHLDFPDYGHADILTDAGRIFADLICKPCQKNCAIDLYRVNLATAVSTFLLAVRNRDPGLLQAIESPQNSTRFDPFITITSGFKYNGYDVLKTGPFCKRL